MNLQKQTDSQIKKTNLWLPKGRRRIWLNYEFEISRHKLLYIKQLNNKVVPYRKGNYAEYPVISHNEKEYEKYYVSTYTQLNHFAVYQNLAQYHKSIILQQK